MNHEGDGDRLARGQKKATFQGGYGEGELRPSIAVEEEGVPDLVDNLAVFAPKKPAVYYRGIPFNKRILVTQVELENNTDIIIPDTAKGASEVGRIKAFSADSELRKLGLNVGDLVLFDRYAAVGQVFPLLNESGETEPTLLLQECDIQMQMEAVKNEPVPTEQAAEQATA
jgi:co-chaperonin GroES (HSP10)